MVMPSVGRRNNNSLASAADLATVAVEMVSKTLATAGIAPLGKRPRVFQRCSISLQPPQAGTKPTPHSTKPI